MEAEIHRWWADTRERSPVGVQKFLMDLRGRGEPLAPPHPGTATVAKRKRTRPKR